MNLDGMDPAGVAESGLPEREADVAVAGVGRDHTQGGRRYRAIRNHVGHDATVDHIGDDEGDHDRECGDAHTAEGPPRTRPRPDRES